MLTECQVSVNQVESMTWISIFCWDSGENPCFLLRWWQNPYFLLRWWQKSVFSVEMMVKILIVCWDDGRNPYFLLRWWRKSIFSVWHASIGPKNGISILCSDNDILSLISVSCKTTFNFNPYKHSVLFLGHRPIVKTQIRRHKLRRLVSVSTVCLQKSLLTDK